MSLDTFVTYVLDSYTAPKQPAPAGNLSFQLRLRVGRIGRPGQPTSIRHPWRIAATKAES